MGRLYTSMRAVQFLCSYSDSGNQLHFSKAEFVGNANTYLPYFSIRPISEQYCDYNNNDDDELGLSRYLRVKSCINPSIHQSISPSVHQSIKQYSGYQNDTTPLSSNPSEVAGPGQTTSSLTRTNKQTEEASKQSSTYNIKKRITTTNWPAIHK